MKFSVAKEHKAYYLQHSRIEFEQLLTATQLQQLKGVVNGLPKKLSHHQDIWRSNQIVRRVIRQDRLVEIAAELTGLPQLRIGYDHLWNRNTSTHYPENTSLNQSSSLQGVACGLIICLEPSDELIESLPSQAGSGIYISPESLLNFSQGIEKNGSYILFVYAHSNAVFIKNPLDNYGTFLREVGYSYGDRLIDSRNPIVYRR